MVDQIYLYNITNVDKIQSFSELRASGNDNENNNNPVQAPKLRIKQVGPITLKQTREKLNIRFDPTNETVLYDQRKSWSFLPEQSIVKHWDDLNKLSINHISVPLAGTTLNAEYAEFIQPIVAEFDLKLFLNHSLMTILFEGYPDILMEQAKSSGQIDVDRFGWLYSQNNTETKNVRVFTGPSNTTLSKFGSVDQYNFGHMFDIWVEKNPVTNNMTKKNSCNDFRFSSAGEFFPPPEDSVISHYNYQSSYEQQKHQQNADLDSKTSKAKQIESIASQDAKQHSDMTNINMKQGNGRNLGKTISLFMPDLCRSYKLYYSHSYNYKESLMVDRYIATKFTYHYTQDGLKDKSNSNDNTNKQQDNQKPDSASRDQINSNSCYCIYYESTKLTSCPPNGMMDLFTCRKGSPLTVSFPHFLHSRQDPSLVQYLNLFEEDNDNIDTREEDYQFYIDLETTLNMPIKAQIVIQFNVHFRYEPSLNFTRDYSFLLEGPQQSKPMTDFYLPAMWIKSNAEIDDYNLNSLKFIQKHLDLVTPITTLAISVVALILLSASAKLFYDSTYGPKSLSQEQESCSSLSRNNSQYLEDKQKYYALQLLGNEKSKSSTSGNKSNNNNHHEQPTTSRADDINAESQPLNR